jgi:hypothetical protein
MPFLETEGEIPMNPRQMHFINILVVAYGRIDGKQSNKNSQLWFYKMLRFFECWKIPSNQPAKAFYKYQSGYFFSMTGPAGSELSTLLQLPVTNHKGGTQWGDTMGRIQWEENNRKMRNVTFMLGK